MSATDEKEPSSGFKSWYALNKDALSQRRKAKYRQDPEHRDAIIDRQREYRKNHPTPSRAGQTSYRLVAGKKQEVFRIGKVAEMIGRTDQTIRDWEASDIIPKPTVQSAHRYYTKNQVKLMGELADLIDLMRKTDRKDLDSVVAGKSEELHQRWTN